MKCCVYWLITSRFLLTIFSAAPMSRICTSTEQPMSRAVRGRSSPMQKTCPRKVGNRLSVRSRALWRTISRSFCSAALRMISKNLFDKSSRKLLRSEINKTTTVSNQDDTRITSDFGGVGHGYDDLAATNGFHKRLPFFLVWEPAARCICPRVDIHIIPCRIGFVVGSL